MTQFELDQLIASVITNDDAAKMVSIVSRLVRHADNCVDREHEPPAEAMSNAITLATVDLACNPFYVRHQRTFGPLLATIFVVWDASEHYAKSDVIQRRQWAFARRDLVEVVLFLTAMLLGGHRAARYAVETFIEATIGTESETFSEWDAEQNPPTPAPAKEEIL